MTNTEYKNIVNSIKAKCPDVVKFIQVSDDWYGSYEINNKLFVKCTIVVGYNQFEMSYYVYMDFFGNDDFGLNKVFYFNNIDETIKKYRELRRYSKKVPRKRNLKDILLRDGFIYF